ncbi:hypothetical protein N7539_007702, partial [Penicillium diatomitis]
SSSNGRILGFLTLLGINGFCNTFKTYDLEDAGQRAARLALVNLIPLFLGGSHDFAAHSLGFSLDVYSFLHRSFAVAALLEAVIHVAIVIRTTSTSLNIDMNVYGIVAASILLSLFVLPFVRRRVYEIFLVAHKACAIAVVYAIWQHTRSAPGYIWLFSALYALILTLTVMMQFLRTLYQNVTVEKSLAKVNIQCYPGDTTQLRVLLPRPWKVRAGQRVNLSVPHVGIQYALQSHPFTVAWWETDRQGKARSFTILLRPQSGFTQKMVERLRPDHSYKAWTSGLYGPKSINWHPNSRIGNYGHVFFATTGIGIAAQLPYIKELLDGHQNATITTQKICLIWQLDQIGDWESARDLLQCLVRQDNGYVSFVPSVAQHPVPFNTSYYVITNPDATSLSLRRNS